MMDVEGRSGPSPPEDRPRDPHRVPGASSFRVAVTRPDTGDDRLREALEARGFTPVDHPLLRIVPPEDPAPLRRLVRELVGGPEWPVPDSRLPGSQGPESPAPVEAPVPATWLLVTSRQVIRVLDQELSSLNAGPDEIRVRGVRVAAVGSATADALTEWGLPPDLVPDRFTGDDLLDTLVRAAGEGEGTGAASTSLAGHRFLFPRAERAREVLPEGLRARGAHVELVTAYRIVPDPEGARELWAAVERGEVEVVTFTSGSAVRTLAGVIPEGASWPPGVRVAVIGPVTAGAAEGTPIPIHHVPAEFTLEALAAAIDGDDHEANPTSNTDT
ncbi:MAG: uroporphyrinogen-III synthase [Gemmatimonadales bacterium]|nr:MAG: uroporphyrinogen-III synthase [Gemmatimonadales bacterium]